MIIQFLMSQFLQCQKLIEIDRTIVLNVFKELYENKADNLPNEICCKGRSMENEESFR